MQTSNTKTLGQILETLVVHQSRTSQRTSVTGSAGVSQKHVRFRWAADHCAGTWEPEIRRKVAGKRHFLATQLFQCSNAVFHLLRATFGENDVRIAEKRMLQYNFCSALKNSVQLWHVAGVGFRRGGFRNC